MKPEPALNGTDLEAVQTAVDVLTEAGFDVQDIDDLNRQNDDQRVRWTMTVEKETRTQRLAEFKRTEGPDGD